MWEVGLISVVELSVRSLPVFEKKELNYDNIGTAYGRCDATLVSQALAHKLWHMDM